MMARTMAVNIQVSLLVILLCLFVSVESKCYNCYTEKRQNVLFIIADDLRPQLGAYYDSEDFPDPRALKPHTPNLDQLAKRSIVLKRAYVQYSVCGPSRTSFLTGRRPDTTRTYNNGDFVRTSARNFTTIPQYFKEHGYETIGIGKIFHETKNKIFDPISWTTPFHYIPLDRLTQKTWWKMTKSDRKKFPLHDDIVLDRATQTLRALSKRQIYKAKPFFLSVGFYKPHLKFACPKEFFKYYPIENITLPENMNFPVNVPKYEWVYCDNVISSQLKTSRDIWTRFTDHEILLIRKAYYACVSYMDSLVGQLLQTLKDVNMHRNTIVSFIGDHGFALGKKLSLFSVHKKIFSTMCKYI